MACVDADTTSCMEDYADTPVCEPATGECVQCTSDNTEACSADTPACDAGVCVPCDEHDQCPASACDMSSGACMSDADVWWVDSSAAGPGDG